MYNINEIIISRLSEKYNFPCTIHNNTVYIKSKYDEWYAEQDSKRSKITLYHKNKADKHWHFQREFLDFPFMFDSIRKHDEFNISSSWNKYKHSKTAKLFDMISCELHGKKQNKNKNTYMNFTQS